MLDNIDATPLSVRLRDVFDRLKSITLRHDKALNKIIVMNRDLADVKFGNAELAETWACVRVARAALACEDFPSDEDLEKSYRAPWVARSVAYKLLLAYAEFMDVSRGWAARDKILDDTGCGTPEGLRQRALEAAKEAG